MGDLVGSRALNINSDPSLVLQQALINREKQYSGISNPQQQLAARLGGMLGGGITNLVNDRGFFDVNDPLLNKVTKIQGVYNKVASQIDPASNPEQFYLALQKEYSQDPELGQQALMAAQEAQKAKKEGTSTRLAEIKLLEKDIESIPAKIQEAQERGDVAEVNRLAGIYNRVAENRGLDIAKTKAEINRINAQTKEVSDRIESGKFDWKVINNAAGAPIGVQTINKKTGDIELKEIDPEIAKKFLEIGGSSTPTKGGDQKGDKKPLSEFGTKQQPVASPKQETTWSGVPVAAKPVTPLTSVQQRDYAIQRAYPTIPVSSLTEEAKAQLAQQLGL